MAESMGGREAERGLAGIGWSVPFLHRGGPKAHPSGFCVANSRNGNTLSKT